MAVPVLISAHRCGGGDDPAAENSLEALAHAVAAGVDYVEFDVRRRADGSLVVVHDEPGEGVEVLAYDDLLAALAGRGLAHLDLKLRSEGHRAEIEAVARAVEILGDLPHVVTTGRVATARAIRRWADERGLHLLVGLSIGGSVSGLPLREQVRRRWAELFPAARVTASSADVVVAHQALAALTLRRLARRRRLRLLVWTVDHPVLLRWWLHPGRAWLVTTNHPQRALALRRRRRRLAH